MAVAKQLQTLEILLGLLEQAAAHAGSPAVAVLTEVVYVAQNARPDATTLLAHGSVLGLVHPNTQAPSASRVMNGLMSNWLLYVQMEVRRDLVDSRPRDMRTTITNILGGLLLKLREFDALI